jgi:hypothetical protein
MCEVFLPSGVSIGSSNCRCHPKSHLLPGSFFFQAVVQKDDAISRQHLFGVRFLGAALLSNLFSAALLCGLSIFWSYLAWIN